MFSEDVEIAIEKNDPSSVHALLGLSFFLSFSFWLFVSSGYYIEWI